MAQEKVTFRISGDFITHHCRSLVLEDNWGHAVRTLVDGIDGISLDLAHKVLLGTHKIIGNEHGLDLVEEDPTVTENQTELLKVLYAGRRPLKERGGRTHWVRPTAYVTDYGPDDMTFAEATVDKGRGHLVSIKTIPRLNQLGEVPSRARAYLQEGELVAGQATIQTGDNPKAMIFETCEPVPEPLATTRSYLDKNNVQQVVDEYLASRDHLESRGWKKWFGDSYETSLRGVFQSDINDPADETEETTPDWAPPDFKLLREQIWKQNGDADFLEIPVLENGKDQPPVLYRIARKPFLCYALWRTKADHLMPKWEAVCPMGVKRIGIDDPLHSDWLLSAYRIEDGKQVWADVDGGRA